ncbi:hypothetical protein [Roseibium sp. Sym1]|uniref:hypothetical protein n=1 Tax=Roseibium sp. Sym1 TaxID=3016006 RepID=UPI0022B5AB26|nr:hypothetical protein [Roseibium sp. Sym1]
MNPNKVVSFLNPRRFPLHSETALQDAMFEELKKGGFRPQREVRLSKSDVIDLVVGDVGIECKVKKNWSKNEILKQLERYCAHRRIRSIILATNIPMALPLWIQNKPAHFLNLARTWL